MEPSWKIQLLCGFSTVMAWAVGFLFFLYIAGLVLFIYVDREFSAMCANEPALEAIEVYLLGWNWEYICINNLTEV